MKPRQPGPLARMPSAPPVLTVVAGRPVSVPRDGDYLQLENATMRRIDSIDDVYFGQLPMLDGTPVNLTADDDQPEESILGGLLLILGAPLALFVVWLVVTLVFSLGRA